jgi:hypothetical protein
MKNVLTGISLVAIMMLAMTSCADPEASALLTDGAWTFKNLTTDSDDDAVKDAVQVLKLIHIDATLEFQDGGDYLIEFALGDPESGSWELIGDDQLILNPDEGTVPASNSQTLTEDRLTYIQTWPDQELGTFSMTFVWER